MSFYANPEFQKNFWLKFSVFLLIAVPFLVGMVLAICIAQSDDWQKMAYALSLQGASLILFVWGTYEASNSIASEVKNNTWDFQRMSSIGPWEMTFGKLFGSTSYVWYFAAVLIGVMVYCYDEAMSQMVDLTAPPLYETLTYLMLAAVMGHAVSLYAALENLREKKSGVFGPFILGLAAANITASTIGLKMISGKIRPAGDYDTVWYGWSIDGKLFAIGTILYILACVLVALQRKMRQELQFRNSPIAWTLFLISLCFYLCGFEAWKPLQNLDLYGSAAAFSIYIAMVIGLYIAVVAEARQYPKYQRFFTFLEKRNWARIWENTPMWVPSLILSLVFLIYTLSVTNFEIEGVSYGTRFTTMAVGILLFLLRDALFIHSVFLDPKGKNDHFTLLFYYVVIYLLLPYLCYALTRTEGSAMDTKDLSDLQAQIAAFFFPIGSENAFKALLPPLAECAIAGYFLRSTLKKLRVKQAEQAPKVASA